MPRRRLTRREKHQRSKAEHERECEARQQERQDEARVDRWLNVFWLILLFGLFWYDRSFQSALSIMLMLTLAYRLFIRSLPALFGFPALGQHVRRAFGRRGAMSVILGGMAERLFGLTDTDRGRLLLALDGTLVLAAFGAGGIKLLITSFALAASVVAAVCVAMLVDKLTA